MANRWYPPGTFSDTDRVAACPGLHCIALYQGTQGEHFPCEVCFAWVTIPTDPPPPVEATNAGT